MALERPTSKPSSPVKPGTAEATGEKRMRMAVLRISGEKGRKNHTIRENAASDCPAWCWLLCDMADQRSSSGMKSSVMDWMPVRSWVYLTPAASIMRLEAMVVGVVAYLSER